MLSEVSKKKKLIFFIVLFAVSITYVYSDPVITQMHGIAFWNALFEGKLLKYYQYCVEDTTRLAVYDITTYLIFALWNFPCWLYEKISDQNAMNSGLWLAYGKSLMFFAYVFSVYLVNRLACHIQVHFDNETGLGKIVTIYYAFSPLILMYDVYTGNYDLLELIVILAGIDALIMKNNVRFLLYFSIAVSMKYFAIWIFIPIVLIKEKKVLRIFFNVLIVLAITLLENVVFDKNYVLKTYGQLQERMATSEFSLVAGSGAVHSDGIGVFSLCFVLYALLCIYCYVQKTENDQAYIKMIFYVSTLAWAIFFLIVDFNCYWLVLMVPFLSFSILFDCKNMYIKIILESLFSYSMLTSCMIRQWWVIGYEGSLCSHAVLNGIIMNIFDLKLPVTHTLGEMMANNNLHMYANSTVVASLLALLFISYPGSKIQGLIPANEDEKGKVEALLLARNIMGILVFLAPTIYYCYQIVMYNVFL